jgi:hypothetical protein
LSRHLLYISFLVTLTLLPTGLHAEDRDGKVYNDLKTLEYATNISSEQAARLINETNRHAKNRDDLYQRAERLFQRAQKAQSQSESDALRQQAEPLLKQGDEEDDKGKETASKAIDEMKQLEIDRSVAAELSWGAGTPTPSLSPIDGKTEVPVSTEARAVANGPEADRALDRTFNNLRWAQENKPTATQGTPGVLADFSTPKG